MKVGINLPSQFPMESTTQMMEVYEQVGFDSYWAPDHLLGVFHPDLWSETPLSALAADPDAFYDPFVYGAVVGTMTDRPFGISVTDATRRGAADLARTALTLNDLNPGGFILGIGSGEAESLLPFGYPFDKPVGILEDVLRDLRSLLDTGRMADGGVGRMGLPLQAEGRGKPPVWVAGHGPRMLRLTGQYGDGWIPAWWMKPEEYGAEAADRSPSTRRPPGGRHRRTRCSRSCCSPRARTRPPRCSTPNRSASCSACSLMATSGSPMASSIRSATTRRASST